MYVAYQRAKSRMFQSITKTKKSRGSELFWPDILYVAYRVHYTYRTNIAKNPGAEKKTFYRRPEVKRAQK